MTEEIKEMTQSNITNNNLKNSLIYYKDEKTRVHLVLKNRRFYNGTIIEIRESLLILDDKKIGKIPIPLEDVYLIESFHEPMGVGDGI